MVYFPLDKRKAYKKFLDGDIEIISIDRRARPWIFLQNILRIGKLVSWCDIVHFQKCYYYSALPALIGAWIKNKPIHYDWDDLETKIFYYSNPKQIMVGEFMHILEILIPKVADTVSVSSERLRKLCLTRGVSSDDIFSAPVGVDLQLFKPDSNPSGTIKSKYNINNHIVLYVGQLRGAQYAELLIKAAHVIIESGFDATFMIVGDGYRLKELKQLAIRLDVDRYFIFTGFIAHNKIPYYIAEADICVACFEENDITKCKSPLKIAEYLSCGKAIVASDIGEVSNMVNGAGILTKAGDANSLANGIITLLKDKRLREQMGKRARERAEKRYSWSKTAENLLRAYERAQIKTCN